MIRFDGNTTQRGVRYYLSGRVGYLRAEGNSVVALVTGSREAPYTVFLNIDHPEGSRCTCPVGLACKHLVATIAAVLEGRLKNPRLERALDSAMDTDALYEAFGMVGDLEIESEESSAAVPYLGLAPEPDDPVGEYVVELQEEVEDVRTVRTPSPAVSGVRIVDDESVAAWRVALVVGLDYGRSPTLGLVRQYRRQDGEYGRLDRIQPDEPVFLPDPGAEPLVERLEALGGDAALIAFADELIGLDLPLFEATTDRLAGAHNRPATLIRAERLELDVEPIAAPRDTFGRTLGHPNAEISLELTVHVYSGASRHTIEPRSTHGMHGVATGMGKSLMLFAGRGMVIIAESRMQLAVLARFFRYDGCASPADVASLRRIVATAPDLLVLRFPPRIRVVTVDPEPRFVLAEAGGSITMSLEAGGLPEDGYVDGEYRIHRATARVSPEAWRAGTAITGEEPLQRYRDTGWVWQFPVNEGAPSLSTIAFELAGQGFAVYLEDPTRGRRRVRREDRLSVTVSSGTDWFAPSVTDGRGVEIDRQQLVKMGFSGRYIDGNEIVLLDPADIDRMRRLLTLVEGRADRRSSRADLATLLDMADLADNVDPDLDAMRSLAHTVLSGASAEKLEPPPGLKATLRSYQREGYAWLAMLAHHRLSGCLADDMGLGKTVQALALMLLLHEQPREETPTPGTTDTVPLGPGGALLPGGFLVVAPVSTIGNWEREAARFAPVLDVLVHHGPGRSSTVDELVAHDLVLTSYATAVRD
ncbi:MAG: SNF2-related protein, partial [Spirochaetota bacterium]